RSTTPQDGQRSPVTSFRAPWSRFRGRRSWCHEGLTFHGQDCGDEPPESRRAPIIPFCTHQGTRRRTARGKTERIRAFAAHKIVPQVGRRATTAPILV